MKYKIRLDGLLPTEREAWFEGWQISHSSEDNTLLIGVIQDQIALHGTLNKICDLNITILSVERIRPSQKMNSKK